MQNEKYSCGNDPQPEKNIELPVRITEESGDEKMEYDDLSDIPHEQKMEILNGLAIIASKQFLGYFLAFGLKSHIEQMIVEENSGQEYILSFRTLPEHMKKRPLEQDEQPDMAKLLEEKEREIERLKEQVNDLKMDAAAHEYNEIERLRYQEEYERQLLEEKDEAIRELRAGLEDILTINPSAGSFGAEEQFEFMQNKLRELLTKYKQP